MSISTELNPLDSRILKTFHRFLFPLWTVSTFGPLKKMGRGSDLVRSGAHAPLWDPRNFATSPSRTFFTSAPVFPILILMLFDSSKSSHLSAYIAHLLGVTLLPLQPLAYYLSTRGQPGLFNAGSSEPPIWGAVREETSSENSSAAGQPGCNVARRGSPGRSLGDTAPVLCSADLAAPAREVQSLMAPGSAREAGEADLDTEECQHPAVPDRAVSTHTRRQLCSSDGQGTSQSYWSKFNPRSALIGVDSGLAAPKSQLAWGTSANKGH